MVDMHTPVRLRVQLNPKLTPVVFHKPSHLLTTLYTYCPVTQVVPANPCTGVENWDTAAAHGCPGEAIWDTGAEEIDRAKPKETYGMAINPIGRRGHHQVRCYAMLCYAVVVLVVCKALSLKCSVARAAAS